MEVAHMTGGAMLNNLCSRFIFNRNSNFFWTSFVKVSANIGWIYESNLKLICRINTLTKKKIKQDHNKNN